MFSFSKLAFLFFLIGDKIPEEHVHRVKFEWFEITMQVRVALPQLKGKLGKDEGVR